VKFPFLKKETIVSVGVYCFFVLTTVSGLVTTYGSREAIYLIRLIAVVFVSIATLLAVARSRIARSVAISLVLYLFAFLYAIDAAIVTGGLEVAGQSLVVDFIVSICGIILFGTQFHASTRVFPCEFLKLFVYYAIGSFLLTCIFGGFAFELPLRFVFDVGSDLIGREENYSLGMTSFFMLASIFASIGIVRSGLNIRGLIYFSLLFLFLFLSILGGGRGELIVGFLIIVFVLFIERKVRLVSIAAFGVLALVALMINWASLFEDIVALQRFHAIFGGDLSSRDLLMRKVLDLLIDQPLCMFLGCGPGFFQKYYGYEFGFYPHNSIAEALLIFGLPLLVLGLTFAMHGFITYYKRVGRFDLFMVFFVYNCLVSLKSGYLFGSWVLVAGVFFFIGVCFSKRRIKVYVVEKQAVEPVQNSIINTARS
jgi:hypothetical protein